MCVVKTDTGFQRRTSSPNIRAAQEAELGVEVRRQHGEASGYGHGDEHGQEGILDQVLALVLPNESHRKVLHDG
jgi:hypothetical protein